LIISCRKDRKNGSYFQISGAVFDELAVLSDELGLYVQKHA